MTEIIIVNYFYDVFIIFTNTDFFMGQLIGYSFCIHPKQSGAISEQVNYKKVLQVSK